PVQRRMGRLLRADGLEGDGGLGAGSTLAGRGLRPGRISPAAPGGARGRLRVRAAEPGGLRGGCGPLCRQPPAQPRRPGGGRPRDRTRGRPGGGRRGPAKGALKLVVEPEFGEILGAHMVGVGATEVIAQVAAAIELEADYRDLAKVHHLHPSLAELVTDAVASI